MDGCLRVATAYGTTTLILWPAEAALRDAEGGVRIVASDGRTVARIGEPIALGGGEAPAPGGQLATATRVGLREAPPARCPGPYWLAHFIEPGPPLATRAALPPPPADTRGTADALDRDARQYAADNGVSVPEARRRLELQGPIGELGAALERGERETFAGLWVEHRPTYRVVATFTRDGERTIRPYIAGGPLADIVEVRTARFTLAELEAAHAATLRLVPPLGVPVSVRLDLPGNRVEIAADERARLDAALRDAGVRLPVSVVNVTVGR